MSNYFKILRPGINSTFQDLGRFGLQHLGIVASGCMDQLTFCTSNKLVGNLLSLPVVDSRGCVQKCEFCDVVAFWTKFQNLTADEIFDTMRSLSKRYNIFRFQLSNHFLLK